MTALELHRRHPELELAPILRVIKYMGLDSAALEAPDVDRVLRLYRHFERDPELVVGRDRVAQETGLDAERLEQILGNHRQQVPFLGSPAHPMVPRVALRMIRAIAEGDDPMEETERRLYTLTEMAKRTGISLASLSKYVKQHPDRVPSERVGKMRKFPLAAAEVFQKIKEENLERRGGRPRGDGAAGQVTLDRRQAERLATLEEELDAALAVARDLARSLGKLGRQVRRLRRGVERDGRQRRTTGGGRRGRHGGNRRPDTIVAACKQVLTEAEGPMRVAEITSRVIAMGADIRAKNPNVTVSSILSSYDDFTRVKRGFYRLAS